MLDITGYREWANHLLDETDAIVEYLKLFISKEEPDDGSMPFVDFTNTFIWYYILFIRFKSCLLMEVSLVYLISDVVRSEKNIFAFMFILPLQCLAVVFPHQL